jgi:hydroxypyruvate reductase
VKSLAELRADARKIFTAGVRSAEPFAAVTRHVEVNGAVLTIDGRSYDLTEFENIFVVGCGKAAAQMARALEEILGDRISGGSVVVKYCHGLPLKKIKVIEAGHPIPDDAGVGGARQVLDLAARAGARDVIFTVISGGGSALLPLPADGLSLTDKQRTTEVLLASGATIHEINALRKHLSAIKGGRLAERAYPARVAALILSDVVGDNLDAIASGPTVGDPTTFADCLAIVRRYGLENNIPPAAIDRLERGARGEVAETAKPAAALLQNVQNVIVGSNRMALDAAKERARELGYKTTILSSAVVGESRIVAAAHAARVIEIIRSRSGGELPLCLVSGGETTVTLSGGGLGGRNQEFALAAAIELAGLENAVVLSAGTDGSDGPTDAAGAIVDGATAERGEAQGLNAREFLERNDSYPFLRSTGDLLITGPTLTNVMDLQVTLIG